MRIMTLLEYIDEYHGGVKARFAEANGMGSRARVTKILKSKKPPFVIQYDNGDVYLASENRKLNAPKIKRK